MLLKWGIVAVYCIFIIVVGIIGLKRTRTFGDFFLGGSKIGPWLSAFSYGAAYFSAVLFVGFAGKIGWNFGYSSFWITVGNALVGVLLIWWLLGPKVKEMSTRYQVATMSEFFERRYDSKFLKIFSSIILFLFFVPYSAAVFIGLSYLFKSNFGVDYGAALLFMGLLTSVYLVLGGYKSMTMVDIVFGIIMLTGAVMMVLFIVGESGGLAAMTRDLSAIDPGLVEAVGPPGFWPLFSLVFITSVGPWGMPQLVQKYLPLPSTLSVSPPGYF
jgi:SSS family solute:Na+ symporter/sodium/proline symporter